MQPALQLVSKILDSNHPMTCKKALEQANPSKVELNVGGSERYSQVEITLTLDRITQMC